MSSDPSVPDEPLEPSPGPPSEAATAPGRAGSTPGLAREGPGTRIGAYRILQRLGEGGFGSVFLAEQEEPVQRRVALKIIKLGMDTHEVVGRFNQERQALALMDHPNIAKVLDAGATETGRPYFVMELVRGVPISQYCDQAMLSARARLELFIPVCHAVQHAHQKGVIHRDIKPSNILVTLQDGSPVPKVIDFGVAKATNARLTERTVFTERGQLIGTPAYMSPEQAEMSGLDIDTRTDVYSLGVLLYELLTGTTPFDTRDLMKAGFGEIQQIIREVDPPRPSARISSLGESMAAIAARRGTEPKKLGALVRGDLDWIVMKAMEKDRRRRYETASGLAGDVQRHLLGEPVEAAPPGVGYRARKFVRRNRGAVAGVTAVALALLVGSIGTGVGFVHARRAARAERVALQQEMDQRMRAEATAEFLRDMLSSIDPERAKGHDVTVKEVLDRAAENLDTSLADQPEVEVLLRHTFGETYGQLSRYRESASQFRREVELRTRALGPDDRLTLGARYGVGAAMLQAGDVDEAVRVLEQTAEDQERVLGEEDPETLVTWSVLGYALQLAGRSEAALEVYQRVLPAQIAVLGEADKSTLETRCSIADVLQALGRLDEAEVAARELIAQAIDAEGPDGAETLTGQSILVSVLTDLGRYSEAEGLGRLVLAAKTRIYGPDHSATIVTANTLALTLERLDKFDEAVDLLREAVEASSRTVGPEHSTTLALEGNLARNEQLRGNLEEAERIFRRVLEIDRRVSGETATATLAVMNNLGLLLLVRDRPDEAEPLLRQVESGVAQALPEGHWMRGQAQLNLGRCYAAQGELAEAEKLMLEGYCALEAALPAGHDRLIIAADAIADMYAKAGDPDREAEWRAKAKR